MIRALRMGPSARVAVLSLGDSVHVVMSAGPSKLAVQVAQDPARALHTELGQVLPPGAPSTHRPTGDLRPRRPGPSIDRSPPANWPQLVARLRAGKPIPSDAEHVAGLLNYLGVFLT